VKAADSAAPIQVVGANALKNVGQPDLIQTLSQNLPSFNAQGYGADAAALTLSAALRGLNPNDTLILINGKRRHTTGNLAVDGGSPYQGSATTDLSFIPVGAIDHIEVLQDGAAAQYGSDAIAGVVNIILKDADHGGSISATGGQYYEGDGATGAWSLNKGFGIGDKGFADVTLEQRYHDFSRQGGADYRFSNPSGALNSGLSAVDAAGIPKTPGYPDMNNIYGDPQYNVYDGFFNAGYDLGSGVQLYSFGSYGHRDASSYENYRKPSKIEGTSSTGALVVPLPLGFSPREALSEDDYSITVGLKGMVADWSWDLSSTYGGDRDKIYTVNSANAQLFPVLQAASATPVVPQRNFYDGSFTTTEWTNNLDIDRAFNVGLATPLNVAFGAEQRTDSFGITAGEPSSYYGAGAQSFTGYGPTDAGTHTRTSYAGYVDLAVNPIMPLHLDLAGRYEHYSDFGDATVGKLTARYDFTPAFALRGTVSTGFRAPTLAEEFYSGTNVSPAFAQVQLPPNSPAAAVAGFGPLKPEKSTNYSIGFVAHPAERLQITLDAYEIDITNRIVGSGFLLGSETDSAGVNHVISQAILNAISAHGNVLDSGISYAGIQLFTNGVNTKTQGAELTITYASDFGDMGHVDWTAGFNYNETTITKLAPLPAQDVNLGIQQTSLLSPQAITALTTATPREKVVLGAYYTHSKWSVNLRETIYGPSSELFSLNGLGSGAGTTNLQIGVTGITDLDVGYKITDALKLDVGANNLFNTKPPTMPNVSNGSGGVQPADGNNVYGEPAQFSPFGINGGYYYARVTYTF
jgi:iron complex outermembrane receptor protein